VSRKEEKRKKHCWVVKNHTEGVSLMVGADFEVQKIIDLSEKNLVGNLLDRKVGMDIMNAWMQVIWFPLLGYGP